MPRSKTANMRIRFVHHWKFLVYRVKNLGFKKLPYYPYLVPQQFFISKEGAHSSKPIDNDIPDNSKSEFKSPTATGPEKYLDDLFRDSIRKMEALLSFSMSIQ